MKIKYKPSILFFLIFLFFLSSVQGQEERPNILFILTDDQAYGSMGCTGNSLVQTPNLDQLAEDGFLFTNAHVTSAICTPSRISIFLSQFERKHGVNFNSGTSVSPVAWKDAYPVKLRDSGYYTGYVGKNHAPIGEGGYESGLMEESFDYWYAGHGHLKFYPKEVHEIFEWADSETQAEIISEGALDFLSDNGYQLDGALRFLDKRPSDKPFCLSICFNLPHGAGTGSMQMRESDPDIYKTLYRDQEIPLPEDYVAREDITTPKLPAEIHHVEDRQTGYDFVDNPAAVKERITRVMQAMTGIDLLVGKLRDQLVELGLEKNTIIVFTSDHGLFFGQQGLGGKALCYETLTHVPMIVYNPSMGRERKKIDKTALVQTIDVAPTLLDIAGIDPPASYQGKSLLPLLSGNDAGFRKYLYTENLWSTHFGNPRCESVQDRKWKYIRYYKNENISARAVMKTAKEMDIPVNKMLYGVHDPQIAVYRQFIEAPLKGEPAVYEELFDLSQDPGELNNLAGLSDYEAQLKMMREAWLEQIRYARGTGKAEVLRYTVDSGITKTR